MEKLKINNENGNDAKVPELSSNGFVASYLSLALAIFHINMCVL